VKQYPGRLVLLGHPVTHSWSPVFQKAALEAAKIPLVYEAVDVAPESLLRTLDQLKESNAAGNVTIPHKGAVHDACDERTPLAARVGAVNTFWFDKGRLCGDNTDVGGFDAAARAFIGDAVTGARVLLIGAGGSAAAILTAIGGWAGARVTIVSRNADRAVALARRFPDVARAETGTERALEGANLIVNATPVGQHDDDHPFDVGKIPPSAAVFDLVYRRGGTAWVNSAQRRGLRASDGLPMLLEQGALAFQRWFGVEPDREAMRRSVL
jgi:shikimate dehydrogenase